MPSTNLPLKVTAVVDDVSDHAMPERYQVYIAK